MRELVKELRKMGKTILVSSHILPELEELCTWVGFIDGGKMVAVGPMAEVRDKMISGRRLRVEVLVNTDLEMARVAEAIRETPGVSDVRVLGDALEVAVEETFEDEKLLAALISREVKVRSFAPIAGDLSEAFLRLTGNSEPEPEPEVASK
jgi:ABC-2 type transport system ATP-binding protein